MAVFRCKMCGGMLELEEDHSIATCKYCGTQQTLPKLNSDKRVNLYDRANHFRRNNDFDKAMAIYEQILNEDGTDAEAYWSIILCRYGIEYVEDPVTHHRIPTVNRTQFTSVLADEDYKSALAHAADDAQRALYEQEAKAIDEIQKGILAISGREEPFDVFICYKETDKDGRRTHDSVLAQELYYGLKNEGFKVFFSRITLEDKLGTAYEPYIFAALNSAKVMVVLGTRAEYFNAVWVKNEWSRYLTMIRGGAEKTLIPAYRDMDPYDLPEEFSHLQAQDMSKLGFMQDLIRGIKKIIGKEKQEAPRVQIQPPVVEAPPVVEQHLPHDVTPLLKRAFLFLEAENWKSADAYFERVLNQDPENGEAYLGKLLASLKLKSVDLLIGGSPKIAKNSNFALALKFSTGEARDILSKCKNTLKTKKKTNKKAVLEGFSILGIYCVLVAFFCLTFIFGLVSVLDGFYSEYAFAIALTNSVFLMLMLPIFLFFRRYFIPSKKKEARQASTAVKVCHRVTLIGLIISEFFAAFFLCTSAACGTSPTSTCIIVGTFLLIVALTVIYLAVLYQKRKLYLLVRIVAAVVIAAVTVGAVFLFYISPLLYKQADDGAYCVLGTRICVSRDIVVPETHNGKPVTSIGDDAFYGCSGLTSITIPDSVTSIGEFAFYGCRGLTNITIPDGVTSIGDAAFSGCRGLTNITIPDGVTSIGYAAFRDCSELTSITIPDSVTSIDYYAFDGCTGLTSITIPDSVTSIGESAFEDCSGLTSITLPFVGATLNGTTDTHFGYIFGASSFAYNDDYVPTSLKAVIITGGTSIGSNAFRDCSGLTSITIPDSVTSIGSWAFSGCSKLTSITFGENSQLTSIGDSAFYGCSGLTSITFGANSQLTSIGEFAFSGCSKLTSITIPDSVTSIDGFAFHDCSGLTSITIPDSVTSIGRGAFRDCSGLMSVIFENPNGWWYASSSNATSGTSISSSDLANRSTAATYLKSKYDNYYWKRG